MAAEQESVAITLGVGRVSLEGDEPALRSDEGLECSCHLPLPAADLKHTGVFLQVVAAAGTRGVLTNTGEGVSEMRQVDLAALVVVGVMPQGARDSLSLFVLLTARVDTRERRVG
jgi:hypothetical protein